MEYWDYLLSISKSGGDRFPGMNCLSPSPGGESWSLVEYSDWFFIWTKIYFKIYLKISFFIYDYIELLFNINIFDNISWNNDFLIYKIS